MKNKGKTKTSGIVKQVREVHISIHKSSHDRAERCSISWISCHQLALVQRHLEAELAFVGGEPVVFAFFGQIKIDVRIDLRWVVR